MPRPLRALSLLPLALALVLAACSQGPGATTAATGGTATLPPGAPSAPGPTGGGAGSSTTPACDLLSDAEIKEIAGLTVAAKNPEPADTVYANVCRWTFEEHGEMDLGVLGVDAKGFFDRTAELEGNTEIPGLGDDAFLSGNTGSVFVLVGDTMLDLFTVGTGTSQEVEVELLRTAIARLRG